MNRRPHGPKPCALPLRYTPLTEIIFPTPMAVKNRMSHFPVRGHGFGAHLELGSGPQVVRGARQQNHEQSQDVAGIRCVPAGRGAEPRRQVTRRPETKVPPRSAERRFGLRPISPSWRISPALSRVLPGRPPQELLCSASQLRHSASAVPGRSSERWICRPATTCPHSLIRSR